MSELQADYDNPWKDALEFYFKDFLTARQQWKWRLIRALYERGYNRGEIVQLFRLIDWMMTLPKELQNQLETQLAQYQEEKKMPVLSNMEIRGMEKEKLLNAREWLIKVLETRFAEVPQQIQETINQIEDMSRLEQLHQQAITIASLEAFQELLD